MTNGLKPYDGLRDDKPASPEERLWMAVVQTAVEDFRKHIKNINNEMKRCGNRPFTAMYNLKRLHHELSGEWFEYICSHTGIHHSRILKMIAEEARAVGLDIDKPVLNPYLSFKRK